ncbi:helix-turn-helix domain-containing protein [Cupriavidus sp. BIS7]|uniref:helix-turn-helix domain-containing protein n=1 Tax=Cupriavidus sp. BIS7 TaxID=1217718 RepID=UPI00036DA3EF
MAYPRSQAELVRRARGERTQKEFATLLGVEKSCLSRYESGKLGAPTRVIDACLALIADSMDADMATTAVQEALKYSRMVVSLLDSRARSPA